MRVPFYRDNHNCLYGTSNCYKLLLLLLLLVIHSLSLCSVSRSQMFKAAIVPEEHVLIWSSKAPLSQRAFKSLSCWLSIVMGAGFTSRSLLRASRAFVIVASFFKNTAHISTRALASRMISEACLFCSLPNGCCWSTVSQRRRLM